QTGERDQALPASQPPRDLVSSAPPEAAKTTRRPPRLPKQRGHPNPVKPAGHDPRERLQVVLDVDRETVGGHAVGQVDPDRGDLPVLDPHAGIPVTLTRP